MKTLTKNSSRLVLASALGLSLLASSPAAQAREVNVTKKCSKGNSFEFSVDWERQKVDFDFDIERGQPFDMWSIRITRNGETLVRSTDNADEDGDFSREYVRRGQLVTGERWTFVARSESGNRCRAVIRF